MDRVLRQDKVDVLFNWSPVVEINKCSARSVSGRNVRGVFFRRQCPQALTSPLAAYPISATEIRTAMRLNAAIKACHSAL
jgi:hypothetical protein